MADCNRLPTNQPSDRLIPRLTADRNSCRKNRLTLIIKGLGWLRSVDRPTDRDHDRPISRGEIGYASQLEESGYVFSGTFWTATDRDSHACAVTFLVCLACMCRWNPHLRAVDVDLDVDPEICCSLVQDNCKRGPPKAGGKFFWWMSFIISCWANHVVFTLFEFWSYAQYWIWASFLMIHQNWKYVDDLLLRKRCLEGR